MDMVTQLTEDQVQNLDTVAATTVACLGESQYYFKDMSLSKHRGDSLFPDIDPTKAFETRMEELFGKTKQVKGSMTNTCNLYWFTNTPLKGTIAE